MASALLRRLRRNLAELIDPASGRQQGQAAAKSQRAVSPEALYEKLRFLVPVGRDPAARTGEVNLISIARIKNRLDSQWPQHAAKADRIARNAIERYLVSGDIYARWKDTGYIVVFATLDRQQAQIKSMLIGDEITRKLLGEEEQPNLADIQGVEVQSDGELAFSEPLDVAQLVAALPVAAAERGPMKAETALLATSSPVAASETPQAILYGACSSDPLAGISYVYRPSWDPARGVIAAYLCVPQLPEGSSGARRRDAALMLGNDADALQKLDFAVLEHVTGVLDGLVCDKRRLLVTMPVQFETLVAAAYRRRYIAALQARLGSEAASLLVIELVDVPDGVPQARLLEISSPLRVHARAVIAQLRPDTTEFGQFAGSRIAAVGCDIGRHGGSELVLMQQMGRFSRAATKVGIATYLRGVRSLSLAAAALGVGFAHVDGDVIAPPVDLPQGVLEFNLFDLYSPSLGPAMQP